MGQARLQAGRIARLVALVTAVGLVAVASGCATMGGAESSPSVRTVAAATATATTPTIAAFTCAAGSLPVQPASTRTSCVISTQSGLPLLRATYAGASGSQPTIDENALIAAGWKLDLRGESDHAAPSQGYSIYVYRSAWLAFQWATRNDGTLDLTVQTSILPDTAPLTCGQMPAAGGAHLKGIVLPERSFALTANNWSFLPLAIAPACAADVEHFYETALPAAGWHMDIPFVNTSGDPSVAQAKHASFILGNTTATITAAGFPGTPTLIIVTTTPA